jgi:cytochrome c553
LTASHDRPTLRALARRARKNKRFSEATVIRTIRFAGVAATSFLAAIPAAAQTAQPDTTRYVAANCANCHGTLGRSSGAMPSLAGLQKPYFVEQMRLFREGKRQATIMHQIAKGYTEQQVEQLAEHFARQAAK